MYSKSKFVEEFNIKDFNDIAFVCNEMVGICTINKTVYDRLILNVDKIEDIQTIINALEGLKFMLTNKYDKELDIFTSTGD